MKSYDTRIVATVTQGGFILLTIAYNVIKSTLRSDKLVNPFKYHKLLMIR